LKSRSPYGDLSPSCKDGTHTSGSENPTRSFFWARTAWPSPLLFPESIFHTGGTSKPSSPPACSESANVHSGTA